MRVRTIAGCGLAIGLLTALSACVPAYYPGYPAYYPRPAYQPGSRAQPRWGEPQRGSPWINPEPAR
jgi:hypothetical protein